MQNEIYTIENYSFQYPFGKQSALQHITTSFFAGEFVVLCGPSGCGKTTFLRQLKTVIAPNGKRQGDIFYHGKSLADMDFSEQTKAIGFVSQQPEDQVVTDQVWHELAFGLESLGFDTGTIRRKVAEISQFFGIQDWFHKNVAELSGGQKQLLNLASVMVMQPEVLLLDEPTSQLDPIAATDFLMMLHRIHQELGTTIIITEHRLEEVLAFASRMIYMEDGKLLQDGRPEDIMSWMQKTNCSYMDALPTPARIWNKIPSESHCPMSIQEGKEWLSEIACRQVTSENCMQSDLQSDRQKNKKQVALELKNLWFRYDKNEKDILRDVSVKVYDSEIYAILGGNGSGKTTLLSMIYGGRKPQRGKLRFGNSKKKNVVSLPQNPELLFICDTVEEELADMKAIYHDKASFDAKKNEMIELCQLKHVLDQHPYDLSGGEKQRLGLAKVLLANPDILLLDEPTKGIDVAYKQVLAQILLKLKTQGVTILLVSHDVEFCAEYADRCALFFDGQIATEGDTQTFFVENHFYTTQAHRMARHIFPTAVTVEDVTGHFIKETDSKKNNDRKTDDRKSDDRKSDDKKSDDRKTDDKKDDDEKSDDGKNDDERSGDSFIDDEIEKNEATSEYGKPVHRMNYSSLATLLLVPLTIYAGIHLFNDQKYMFISLLIMLEVMVPFFLSYERRKPPARDVVLLSVLCSIAVAGRVAFAAIPQFQPVTAIAIIVGVAYGGEAGFLVGAISMLASNMMFGQGAWTPWQMFAMGLVGYLAGIFFHSWTKRRVWEKRILLRNVGIVLLCIYGFVAVVLVYGGIMNPAAAIMSGLALDKSTLIAYYISGISFDFIHAVSTVLFLGLAAMPLLKKLERVKLKFGE